MKTIRYSQQSRAASGLSLAIAAALSVALPAAVQAESNTIAGFDSSRLLALNYYNPSPGNGNGGGSDEGNSGGGGSGNSGGASDNLIENGGAEAGLSPWEARGDAQMTLATNVRNKGSRSVLVTGRSATWHGVQYPIDQLTSGNEYDVEVWVRLASGSAATEVTVSIQYEDAGGVQYRNVATDVASQDGWTKLSGRYTHGASGNSSGIKVYVESASSTVSYYVDDLVVSGKVDAGSPSTGNPSTGNPSAGNQDFFIGNITTRGAVRSDFVQFWDQITPENEGKWGSVEHTRGQYNWAPLDRIYSYARQNKIPVKGHTLVWGSQCPSWVGGSKCEGHNLSGAELAREIETWIKDYCTRYPDTQYLDVVNEATPGHAPAGYAQKAFGNNWIIKSFQLARQYCPNSVLILNDYNVLSWNTQEFINMARPAVNAGVVDAIGLQAHGLEKWSLNDIRTKLNQVAALGLPLYISEYDVAEPNDQRQLQIYQEQFPLFYNHPSVKGITLWGYVYGTTWVNGSGLIHQDGRQRPAMTWLMNYIKQNPK